MEQWNIGMMDKGNADTPANILCGYSINRRFI
jgi:hypothetical protein